MSKKIRIAHVLNWLNASGKELSVIKIIKNLNPRFFDSCIIVLNEIDPNLDLKGPRVIHLNLRLGNNLKVPFILRQVLKTNRIHIVHTHSWPTLVEGVLGAKLAGVPVIIHGEHGNFHKKLRQRIAQNFLWRLCNDLLSVSEALKSDILASIPFPPDRIKVIINGVDTNVFYASEESRKEFRDKYNFQENDFIIGTVGRLDSVKNHRMLIYALAEMKVNSDNFVGLIVGTGEKEKELKALTKRLDLTQRIFFLGEQRDINLILNGIDVFTLTSHNEACSNVLLEAMACGKAIIATNVGGNKEILSHSRTGLLVENDDYEQLANYILYLKNNPPLRKSMGEQALAEVKKTFVLERMINEYENLYLKEYSKFSDRTVSP